MKRIYFILISIFFVNQAFGQKIALQALSNSLSAERTCPFLDSSIKNNLNKSGLTANLVYEKDLILDPDMSKEESTFVYSHELKNRNIIKEKLNSYKELGFTFILIPVKSRNLYNICGENQLKISEDIWWVEYLLYNIDNKKTKIVKLSISTYGTVKPTLESSSNIISFSQEISDFVQLSNSSENTLSAKKIISNNTGTIKNAPTNSAFISKPSIMVIPNKINPAKLINGEYQLTKYEKMLIAAFKNKFEDNNFTTFGFESVLKRIYENRLINDNVYDDIKSKILEGSGIDFFVEFENLDDNNASCNKVYDFKIRNFSTGEDIASDLKDLNQCGNSDVYKDFASSILNQGAVSKINNQFNSILRNGQKVNMTFTISNTSQARFNKQYNGIKLGVHINNCLQSLSFKGNLELQEESDLRKQATVNIPVIDENSGQRYQTTTFAEEIISYLKKNAGIECDRVVSRQSINIKIR
jgi:hypothetical protein